jgi:hypothetical protein
MTARRSDQPDLLEIYLRDHEAAAAGGLQLFRRCAKANIGTPYAPDLRRLTSDVRADRDELRNICRRFGVRFSIVGRTLAFLGVTLGTLKPNGRTFSYSPLSRVVEFEGLSAGVTAKLRLWESLLLLTGSEPRLDKDDLSRLERDAKDQLEVIVRLHAMAADEAFDGAERDARAIADRSPVGTTT